MYCAGEFSNEPISRADFGLGRVQLKEFLEMFEDAAAEAECRDAEKMTVTSTIMKGLVKALQEDINKVLPARDADTGRLKESLEEKDINTIWYVLSQSQTYSTGKHFWWCYSSDWL
jgi:hypothetical protein